MRRFFARLANLFRRRRAEQEMTREIDSHLALLQEDFEHRGMAPSEAALAARRSYGGVEQAKELHRDERSYVWLEQILKDVRYAGRNLLRNPGFTLMAVIALALGLGGNTTIFAVYNALLLKPLPVADSDHVVRLKRHFRNNNERNTDQYQFALTEYQYLREHTTVFAGLAASFGGLADNLPMTVLGSLEGSATQEHLDVRAASANYFTTFGITPHLGRIFRLEEDRLTGGSPVLVLTYRFWQQRLHGDANAIGQIIKLNGLPYTIIGIAPREFTGTDLYPTEFDFWTPLSMLDQLRPAPKAPPKATPSEGPGDRIFQLFGHLKIGVPRNRAQAETDLLLRQFLRAYRETSPTTALTLEKTVYFELTDPEDRATFQTGAATLWIVVCLVLLAACANVANMLLARGAARHREIGVRLAMGASRGRVIRQLLMESMLLALLGAAVALPLSIFAGRLLWVSLTGVIRGFLNLALPDIRPDLHVLLYGMALSAVTGILFGLTPALRLTRLDLNAAMKGEDAVFGARFGRSRLRGLLLGAQAAISLLLLLVSGAMLSRFHSARTADLGFDTRDTYLLVVEEESGKLRQLENRLALLPEVAGVAMGDPPLGDDRTYRLNAGEWKRQTFVSVASNGYFETMGLHLVGGRTFTREDNGARSAVISESTARRCWPNESPLGKHISLGPPEPMFHGKFFDFEVVGVVRDVRFSDITKLDPLRVYLPLRAFPGSAASGDVVFRIRGNRVKALAAVQSAVEAFDPKLMPSLRLVGFDEGLVAVFRGFNRVLAMVAGIVTLLALTLAVVGIYGVMAFLVGQRTREIGIRIALGATARVLLRGMIVQGLRPVLIGMVVGFAAAEGLGAWERSTQLVPDSMVHHLFGNPLIYAEITLMLAIAILASLAPALRALRVDPMKALRHE